MPKAWRTREGLHILLSARICTESSRLAFKNKKMIWLISLDDSLLTTSPQLVFVRFYHHFLCHSCLEMSASMPMIRNLLALIITKKLVASLPKGTGRMFHEKCRKVVTTMPRCDKYSLPSWFLRSVLFGPYVDVKLLEFGLFGDINRVWTFFPFTCRNVNLLYNYCPVCLSLDVLTNV